MLRWRLHFEFVTAREPVEAPVVLQNQSEVTVWTGAEHVDVDTFSWDLPIKVLPTNPTLASYVSQFTGTNSINIWVVLGDRKTNMLLLMWDVLLAVCILNSKVAYIWSCFIVFFYLLPYNEMINLYLSYFTFQPWPTDCFTYCNAKISVFIAYISFVFSKL